MTFFSKSHGCFRAMVSGLRKTAFVSPGRPRRLPIAAVLAVACLLSPFPFGGGKAVYGETSFLDRVFGGTDKTEKAAAPVKYEDFMSAPGMKKYTRIQHTFSRDGHWMVTKMARSVKPGTTVDDFELWRFDGKENGFVRHPLDREIRESMREMTVSPDGNSIAVCNCPWDGKGLIDTSKARVSIVRTRDGKIIRTFPVYMSSTAMQIMPDNKTLVGTTYRRRVEGGRQVMDTVTEAYSITTGKKIPLPAMHDSCHRKKSTLQQLKLSDRYLGAWCSNGTAWLFDAKNFSLVRNLDKAEGLYLNRDGSLAAVWGGLRGQFKILDTTTWKEIETPPGFATGGLAIAFGPDNSILKAWSNCLEEYVILKGKKLVHVQERRFADEKKALSAVFVQQAGAWYALVDKKVHTMKAATPEMIRAAAALDEGRELLAAGFHSAAVRKIREAMNIFPLQQDLQYSKTYIDYWKRGLPLKDVGSLLLFHKDILLKAEKRSLIGTGVDKSARGIVVTSVNPEGPAAKSGLRKGDVIKLFNGRPAASVEDVSTRNIPIGSEVTCVVQCEGRQIPLSIRTIAGFADNTNLAIALRRLMEYGMLAVHAGHPQLAIEAADEVMKLKQQYPISMKWNIADKISPALKALVMAGAAADAKTYDYLLEQGGLMPEGSNFVSFFITDYPDLWAPLYADRKKLAYILNLDEAKLPKSPKKKGGSPQPYPDPAGRLLTPVTAPKRLDTEAPASPAPTVKQEQETPAPPSKPRVLD